MSIRTTLSILPVLFLAGIFIIATPGCNRITGSNVEKDPPSVNQDLPLIDTVPYGALETAYFALG
jgi:hypothetical protein